MVTHRSKISLPFTFILVGMKITYKKKLVPLSLLILCAFLSFYIASCGEVANVQRIKIIGAGQ